MIYIVNKRNHKSNTCIDVYIGRPSVLGNPFPIRYRYVYKCFKVTRKESIEAYKHWFYQRIQVGDNEIISELERISNLHQKYGRVNLVCWCAPLACHGEIIKEYIEENIL